MNSTNVKAIGTVIPHRIGTRPNRKFAQLKPRLNPKSGQRRKQKLSRILLPTQNLRPRSSRRQQQKSCLNQKPNSPLNPRQPPNLNLKPRPSRLLMSLQPNLTPQPGRRPPPNQNRSLASKPKLNPPRKLSRSRMENRMPNLTQTENLRPKCHLSSSRKSMNFTSS